ncbi:hypothetical protein CJ030_MR7G011453 [Morella rubra]|uniref:Uncharacterized protein n=1 Tax=Morella rubra TaxID=262757 RepID=A0A6A1V337_9ROSI|nr:hypothetical protein CJ030_MR7G011453 [Morella rubra]
MGSSESTLNNYDSTKLEDDTSNKKKVGGAIAVGVGLAAACVAIALLSDSGTTTNKKTMKAPGREGILVYTGVTLKKTRQATSVSCAKSTEILMFRPALFCCSTRNKTLLLVCIPILSGLLRLSLSSNCPRHVLNL